MSIENELKERSGNKCELCSATDNLYGYEVPPRSNIGVDGDILICNTCLDQIENPDNMDANHWHCLNDSMWSEVNAVKVMAWRMLTRLGSQDMLDMMYLEDDVLLWAKATGEGEDEADKVIHKDSNGVILTAGDSVVLIKDLPVKGSSMIAKRGTAVRRISLDHENAEYIEGKVEGQQIVIITKYVKKL
ncbi:MAG: PhnA domain-containing protein [Flavobacteriales bacterium]|nr:PhnA domain-containing protein [Flavobacteriales bacterium]